MIRKVLFPTQFKELDYKALESVSLLKGVGLEEVIFLNVLDRDELTMPYPYGGYLKSKEKELRELAQEHFDEWGKFLKERGISCRYYIKVGYPSDEILKLSDVENVDLIVLGRREKHKLENIIGSNLLKVLQGTKRPVLVFKYVCEKEGRFCWLKPNVFDSVLMSVDFSDVSKRVVGFVHELEPLIKKLAILHVVNEDLSDDEILNLKQKLTDACGNFKKPCDVLIRAGDPTKAIVDTANDYNATMISMGTTGKGRLKALWLGSISQHVTEVSDIPVLLVP